MSYRFHRGDATLTDALRRIARAEIDAALAHAPGAEGAVHDSRKRVKKLRALLRLVRAGFRDAGAENALLRDAAQGLSAVRDAEVLVATHDRLMPEAGESPVRAHLVQAYARAAADPAQAARGEAFRAVLAGVGARIDGWRVRGEDAAVLRAGLVRTRRRAAEAMAAAANSRDPEALHDWRKRIKDIWYQARLFQPVWPAVTDPLVDAARALAEDLGDHHDLAVFAAALDRMPAALAPQAMDLRARAALARSEIEARAFADGARLQAGDAKAVADLWLAWWQTWRDRG